MRESTSDRLDAKGSGACLSRALRGRSRVLRTVTLGGGRGGASREKIRSEALEYSSEKALVCTVLLQEKKQTLRFCVVFGCPGHAAQLRGSPGKMNGISRGMLVVQKAGYMLLAVRAPDGHDRTLAPWAVVHRLVAARRLAGCTQSVRAHPAVPALGA